MKSLKHNILITALFFSFASIAHAIPTLQLYMEGATYDKASESWLLSSPGEFRLWVLGQGGVSDVKLAAAYNTSEIGTILLTPTTASSIYAPQDTTTPVTPVFNGFKADGTIPVMGNGSELPTHGSYGQGISWTEWLLGDFYATSDKVADMTTTPLNWKDGQLNAYDVTVTGFTSLQFDAYDHVVSSNGKYKYVKAPFSHDAEAMPIPEPSTLILLGVGLLGVAVIGRRKNHR